MEGVVLVLCLMAAGVRGGWTNYGIVSRTVETPVDPEILSAIEGVLGPNVDATLRTPVCELEPGVVLDTLEECMAMVTKQMEPECLRALNLNALAAYTKNRLMVARFLGDQQLHRDFYTSPRMSALVPAQSPRPGTQDWLGPYGRVPRRLQQSMQGVVETVRSKVEEITGPLEATEEIGALLSLLPLDVDIEVIMDQTLGTLLMQAVPQIKQALQLFVPPQTCSENTGSESHVKTALRDLISYLKGGFKTDLELDKIREQRKKEIVIQLTQNLDAVATDLTAKLSSYENENPLKCIWEYFAETVESVVEDVQITKMLKTEDLADRMSAIVRRLRLKGKESKDQKISKAFLRTLALTMFDEDMQMDSVMETLDGLVVAMEKLGQGMNYRY